MPLGNPCGNNLRLSSKRLRPLSELSNDAAEGAAFCGAIDVRNLLSRYGAAI